MVGWKITHKITREKHLVYTIKTDSLGIMWGAILENSGEYIQGLWSDQDKEAHIDFFEIIAGLVSRLDPYAIILMAL